MSVDLLTPLLDGGIRHGNFFEGRLLSGRDLREEQEANRLNRWQLGRAIGAGVVEGLFVDVDQDGSDGASPTVTVKKGLAINREGQAIEVHNDIQIRLDREPPDIPADAGAFQDCSVALNTLIPTNEGIYILVASPASGFLESAPKIGLESNGKVSDCGKRYVVDGVRFRLERLNSSDVSDVSPETLDLVDNELIGSTDLADLSRLRNIVAHMCFGTESLAALSVDPFATEDGVSTFARMGAIDDLRQLDVITACDVPLCLIDWTDSGVAFLDTWSIRRPVTQPLVAQNWPGDTNRVFRANAEVSLLQFQEQLSWLLQQHAMPASIVVREYFKYLPACTVVPTSTTSRPRGLTVPAFLTGKTHRDPVFIEGSRLRALISESFNYPSIDVDTEEMLWVYLIRENRQPDTVGGSAPAEPVVVISSGYMPFFGPAQYDISHWDFSNYSSDLL